VVGKRRFGVGLTSMIATLREKLRLPIRQIKWYLEASKRKLEARRYFEREASALCEPYLKNKDCPQQTLCKRIDKHLVHCYPSIEG